MNKSDLEKFARLIVKTGVNVQEGQEVIVNAAVGDAYFVKYVVEEAYKAKAKKVTVEWHCDEISKLNYCYQDVETLADFPLWREEKLKYQVEKLPAVIRISSDDPDGMAGVDQSKILTINRQLGPKMLKYRQQMDNKYQWTIVGLPSEKWATKVFPDLDPKAAFEALWEAILEVTRVKGDPLKNWEEHNANLALKTKKLNELKIKRLHYSSSNGTDFVVDINENMNFLAGGETTRDGVFYNPNIPTEECFTSPIKTSANGVVIATKPLSVDGTLVSDFGFRFENGKIVEVICENEESKNILTRLISTDEGASLLGEVALVPFDSPVNKTNLLFYNTLFDENACCHLAIGRAFTECIKDYKNLSEEAIKALDLNQSVIHVDFMIGSADLAIVADTYDGKMVQIFKDGTWAI